MDRQKDGKAKKLAEALRANLRRRKEQARGAPPAPEKGAGGKPENQD